MNTIAEVCEKAVAFRYRSIDRLILNAYIPTMQTVESMGYFMRQVRHKPILSGVVFKELTDQFVTRIKQFAKEKGLTPLTVKGQQKPGDVGEEALAAARRLGRTGVVAIVVHQECARVFVSHHPKGARKSYFLVKEDRRLVNHCYFYLRDPVYGDGFVRISSYPPFQTRIWLNGHGYLAGELARRGIAFKTSGNCLVEVADAQALEQIAALDGAMVERIARTWLATVPDPLTPTERQAGYPTHLSIYQAEFSDNVVFKDPRTLNRVYEHVLREHLHMGRPDMVKIAFDRRITRQTPGAFATRIVRGQDEPADGVMGHGTVACLKAFYKKSFIKQYNKQGRVLRTEVCVNDPWDFRVHKSLVHLAHLGRIAYHAIGRFTKAQAAAYAPALGRGSFQRLVTPSEKEGKRVAAIRFGTTWAMQLLTALVCAGLSFRAFSNRDLRQVLIRRLGVDPQDARPTRIGYELRKLMGKGLVHKIRRRNGYTLTDTGYGAIMFLVKTHERLLTPGAAALDVILEPSLGQSRHLLDRTLANLNAQFDQLAKVTGMRSAA